MSEIREIQVTDLTDDPQEPKEGTLRWAVSQPEPRRITFRHPGEIKLYASLQIRHPDCDMIGYLAPDQRVTIADWGVMVNSTQRVALRNLRIRCRDTGEPPEEKRQNNKDCICVYASKDIEIINCSLSGAVDENLNVQGACAHVHIADCIIGPGSRTGHSKGPHSMGFLAGGVPAGANWLVLLERCLFAGCDNRNPQFTSDRLSLSIVANCAFYDYVHHGAHIGGCSMVDLLSNIWQTGPSWKHLPRVPIVVPDATAHIHISGNLTEGTPLTVLRSVRRTATGVSLDVFMSVSFDRLCTAVPVDVMDVSKVQDHILHKAGAFPRDAVDRRILQAWRKGAAVAEIDEETK